MIEPRFLIQLVLPALGLLSALVAYGENRRAPGTRSRWIGKASISLLVLSALAAIGQATIDRSEQARQDFLAAQRDDSLRAVSENTLAATTARLEVLREGLRRTLEVTRALLDTTTVVTHLAQLQLHRQESLMRESSTLAMRLESQTSALDTLTAIAEHLETHTKRLVKPLGQIGFGARLTYPLGERRFAPYLKRILGYASDSLRRAPLKNWRRYNDSTVVMSMWGLTVYVHAPTEAVSRVTFYPRILGDAWLPREGPGRGPGQGGPEHGAYSPICAPRIWIQIMTDSTQLDSLEWEEHANYLATYLALGGQPYGWRATQTPEARRGESGIDDVELNLKDMTIAVSTHGDIQVNDNPYGIFSSEDLVDRFVVCETGDSGRLDYIGLRWGWDGSQALALYRDDFVEKPGKMGYACYWAHIVNSRLPGGGSRGAPR